jgi:hypothetical protein
MLGEAIAGFGALKSASETVKSLIQLRDVALMREKAIELQSQILAAQEIALDSRAREEALVAQVRALKQQIAEYEKWDAEKLTYQPRNLQRGSEPKKRT